MGFMLAQPILIVIETAFCTNSQLVSYEKKQFQTVLNGSINVRLLAHIGLKRI